MAKESTPRSRKTAVVDGVLQIVAERGLDGVSVRDVATAADVAIGTVQYYFPTKDEMLTAAYQEVIDRIRARLAAVALGTDVRQNLCAVLAELLPQDRRRVIETRVHLAFAARAATMPALAALQRTALAEIHQGVTQAFTMAWGTTVPERERELAAGAAVAVADGLALHAVSSGTWLSRRTQLATVELAVSSLLARHGPP